MSSCIYATQRAMVAGVQERCKREKLKIMIDEAKAAGSVRLFSVRHEFPTEWPGFIKSDSTEAKITSEIREEHFPYWSKGICQG